MKLKMNIQCPRRPALRNVAAPSLVIVGLLFVGASSKSFAADPPPDYTKQVAPILTKYCLGCHNADDREGELSLETFDAIERGGEHGRVILPGQSDASRLIRTLTGQSKPKMPPQDEPQPKPEEIALLGAWVDSGARGPSGTEPNPRRLVVPNIKPIGTVNRPIASIAFSPDGKHVAIARFREVELRTTDMKEVVHRFTGLPGKVNSVSFNKGGDRLVAASGVSGLYGEARVWNTVDGSLLATISGHRDALYAATIDPAGKILATAGYDRQIVLWDLQTQKQLRILTGHNGAVYGLAFSPDGETLASASADETVKLWRVATGQRLDTLGQPLAEQYTVAFSPDGRYVVAGGADNRIRVWQFVSKDKPQINPLVHAIFAHEGAIVRLAFSADGRALASLAEDRTIKLWDTVDFAQSHVYPAQSEDAQALDVDPSGSAVVVGRMDGSYQVYSVPQHPDDTIESVKASASQDVTTDAGQALQELREAEPNDSIKNANAVSLPVTVRGVIDGGTASLEDADLYRFEAAAGEQWMVEINAARSKSPLDSKIEVLDAEGRPVTRVLLRAVRDSYFTFRGKDSDTSDDFRLQNWEEMELNELLYASGEVVKLYHYPRGPDSGFRVYPNSGKRYGYFDTTPISHALHEPCYIVQPVPPGASITPNGLPVFTIDYENDDDALRKWGSDSRLSFTAPQDGAYFVRVRDVRGFGGTDYKYALTIRPRRPDFRVALNHTNPTVDAGSGKKFQLTAERIDGFDGEIRVDIEGLPPGFQAKTPLTIEAGQLVAYGTISTAKDTPQPKNENSRSSQITATAQVNGKTITKKVNGFGEIKLGGKLQMLITLLPDTAHQASAPGDSKQSSQLAELSIAPGETITARLLVERQGYKGLVTFGKEGAGWNLPHGVFVDNTGLNGVLIPANQSERTIFITAAKWVPEMSRAFFLETQQAGNQCSPPVVLRVRSKATANP